MTFEKSSLTQEARTLPITIIGKITIRLIHLMITFFGIIYNLISNETPVMIPSLTVIKRGKSPQGI